ncbi:radical SAM peptide maturase, CXXX-repeat target family [Bacteroides acidifaciens]|uniref:radical SAM peptide maturase, CXXX-repeat target family n=2 Tax=Bacteroides acidifaciens TaxID=85831 RepID=UPI00260CA9DD|nr:radical SAM peptide maturase, CXXX-repeat target family [Bacteroides acidifaciens]
MAQLFAPKSAWKSGAAKTITFIVTKDCQLACKYCYLVGKNEKERMSWATAKAAIDYILMHEDFFKEESVIWDFIGGEPFLEIELIDKICDYLKTEMFRLNHHWFNSYRFSFSTNGINYDSPKVQNFIEKNHSHLSIGITIDGTPRKHDLNRVWKGSDEKGSYLDVVRNIPLWLSQFPEAGTKVTISSADIPYICESVLHLFSLGIHEVNINVVFENVWHNGDDEAFEKQLIDLADAIIDNGYYQDFTCSFFSELIGKPLDVERDNQNWCGAGRMLAIDAAGNFYPCTRFAAYSLRNKKPIIVGNIIDGIDTDKLRPFLTLDRKTQSTQECLECEIASGCAWCQGENYDAASTSTIFQRSMAICRMHKARVRANNYYWNKLYRKIELEADKCTKNTNCGLC